LKAAVLITLLCLSWFQKKEKESDPMPQIYDIDLMYYEEEKDALDFTVPTTTKYITLVRV